MANWNEIQQDINNQGTTFDITRKSFIKKISEHTKRNTVSYYSGWLQKGIPELAHALSINDLDMNGFMTTFNQLDFTKELDLILHTPGGEVAATESIINYIKSKFPKVRVIVPQLAMSGGTMIACVGNEIIMGNHSSLGPVDPQFGNMPAHGVIEEFNRAHTEIKEDTSKLAVWQFILQKYNPSFIGECIKAVDWSRQILEQNLKDRMGKKPSEVKKISDELCDHSVSLSHARHLNKEKCKEIGLNIVDLETDQKLQDLILSYHHSVMITFSSTPAIKIIENNKGISFVQVFMQQSK